MHDDTEDYRREMIESGFVDAAATLVEALGGKTWSTAELQRDFVVRSFLAPYVLVTERASGRKGTLLFRNIPRTYYDWKPEED